MRDIPLSPALKPIRHGAKAPMLTLVSKPDTPVLPLALGPDLTGGATAQEGGAPVGSGPSAQTPS